MVADSGFCASLGSPKRALAEIVSRVSTQGIRQK
jgi:hypothetical protein